MRGKWWPVERPVVSTCAGHRSVRAVFVCPGAHTQKDCIFPLTPAVSRKLNALPGPARGRVPPPLCFFTARPPAFRSHRLDSDVLQSHLR